MCISDYQVSFDEKGLEAGVRRSTRRAYHKQSVGPPGAAGNSVLGSVHRHKLTSAPYHFGSFPPGGLLYTHMTLFFTELAMFVTRRLFSVICCQFSVSPVGLEVYQFKDDVCLFIPAGQCLEQGLPHSRGPINK